MDKQDTGSIPKKKKDYLFGNILYKLSEGQAKAEFAKRCGISEHQLSSYIGGRREPDISTLVSIADHLSISVDYLLGFYTVQQLLDPQKGRVEGDCIFIKASDGKEFKISLNSLQDKLDISFKEISQRLNASIDLYVKERRADMLQNKIDVYKEESSLLDEMNSFIGKGEN